LTLIVLTSGMSGLSQPEAPIPVYVTEIPMW
jgi:hypothetical protein